MGEWLFKEDNYEPEVDKDKFIDKSMLIVLKVLSKIRREDVKAQLTGYYILNPVLKLLFTILLAVFVSLSTSWAFVGSVCIYLLVSLLLLKRADYKRIITTAVLFSIFSAVMLMPSMLMGNLENSLFMIIKIFITIALANLLAYSTSWSELARALKLFFIPDIFILILELTIRYIYLLGEASVEMLQALKLRAVGRNNSKYSSVSSIAGSLFLKSKDMGEELYEAMECRGFTGEYKSVLGVTVGLADIIYMVFNAVLIVGYFILR